MGDSQDIKVSLLGDSLKAGGGGLSGGGGGTKIGGADLLVKDIMPISGASSKIII